MSETVTPTGDGVPVSGETVTATPPPAPAPTSSRSSTGLAVLALLIGAAGLAAGGWSVWQTRTLHMQDQAQMAQLEDARSQTRQLEVREQGLAAQFQRLPSAEELEERRRQLAQLQGDQQHLAQQFQEVVGQSRQTWRLTEAEHLLRMATLRLTALQDIPSAQNLLQAVDEILKAQNDPGAFAVRQQLANSQQALRQLPELDRTGLFVQLAALRDQVQHLEPLPPRFAHPEPDQPGVQKEEESDNRFVRAWQRLRERVSGYFRIDFSADKPIKPLLADETLAQTRLAMNLALEQAQWGALNGNQEVYERALTQAQAVLEAHFNSQNPDSRGLRETLASLSEKPVALNPPDLSPTLAALQAYIARRESPESDQSPAQAAPAGASADQEEQL
ncbi:uroporphyrin-3 C-methyltransferase [Pseudomonas duriflava]|uniref:Uroporphyrin-3 C-methyltransferase n=1 Tax=Pseudomonas duriflava TaxID=459528 RepID=A0A562QL84_9PSED|nr:uroporphyrinogen-III C-methyltransferase [Pseudomonas duriflava]TWI57511.1 uroporphyrin-3 C-methyltransferase [Pseudomonas duriflava]